MNALSNSSMFGATPLEVKAESLAVLLRAGLDDDFTSQFQREIKSMTTQQAEALVALINVQLAGGVRRRDLKLVLSQKTDEETTVTVMDRSRLFGSSWSVARQTFAF